MALAKFYYGNLNAWIVRSLRPIYSDEMIMSSVIVRIHYKNHTS
ncbi:hypothetical protein [Nostoc sphaeroides]|uniref:Uncharacterized protein n=1 Tax=Nostoc sphaeroides CCNUC1 TaxID=2653204 RepID=A0A5P8W8B5_9NOSO|nr:hypothetical protein [Nostoc sphaeroides]QFS48900.1 hypothetical protein GXM_06394 [Nostoc sphaeroides CCNUC1]